LILGSPGRECFSTATLTETVAAWNRSVAGAKSEDTTLVCATSPEALTETGTFPRIEVEADRVRLHRPDILVL
jgi:hypothetical protein